MLKLLKTTAKLAELSFQNFTEKRSIKLDAKALGFCNKQNIESNVCTT